MANVLGYPGSTDALLRAYGAQADNLEFQQLYIEGARPRNIRRQPGRLLMFNGDVEVKWAGEMSLEEYPQHIRER
jgi:hypothetical protein